MTELEKYLAEEIALDHGDASSALPTEAITFAGPEGPHATAALGEIPPERFVADMKAGLDELAKRAPNVKLGAIGFCFGGGMTWRLVAAKDQRLAKAWTKVLEWLEAHG